MMMAATASAAMMIPMVGHGPVEPRAPFGAGAVGWRRMSSVRSGRRRMGAVLARPAKGRERRRGTVINAAAGAVVGIQRLDEVPEGHRVRLLLRTHDEALARVVVVVLGLVVNCKEE